MKERVRYLQALAGQQRLRYGLQFFPHAAGVLASMRMKAMRHGLLPLLTQA
jgi:hypothetical protein